jgi:single-strand DNA-binding protein
VIRRLKAAGPLLVVWALATPAWAVNKDMERLQIQVSTLQTQISDLQHANDENLKELKRLNESLADQGALFRKTVQDRQIQDEAMRGSLKELSDRLAEIGERLQGLQASGVGLPPGAGTAPAPMAPPPGETAGPSSPPTAAATPPPPAPRELYSQAYADYARGNYDVAIQGFQEYLRAYPDTDFSDNAQYWVGECLYGKQRYADAIEAWNTLLRDYPSSDKLPDARYKKGLALERLGRRSQALVEYRYVATAIPTPRRAERRARNSTLNRRGRLAGAGNEEDNMASVNKVILIGNLGKDPEMRYTQAGDPIANFSLATNEVWTDKSGQKQERTEWHRVEVFGKPAQVVRDYLTKGRQVYLEGSIRYDEWTDKDGNKRNTTKIRISGPNSKLVLLGARGEGGGSRGGPSETRESSGRLPTTSRSPTRTCPSNASRHARGGRLLHRGHHAQDPLARALPASVSVRAGDRHALGPRVARRV